MTRRPLQPGPRPGTVEDLVQTRRRQRRAAPGSLQHHEHPIGPRQRPLLIQVAPQGGEEPRRHRHYPLPPALAFGDEQPPLPGIDVLEPQTQHLAASQPAQHHRIDHRPVTVRAQRRPQRVDLARRQHPRQRPRGADQRHPALPMPSAGATRRQAGRNRVAGDAGVTAGRRDRRTGRAHSTTGGRSCAPPAPPRRPPDAPPARPGGDFAERPRTRTHLTAFTWAGSLATTSKKIFKSDATARQVLIRARAATKAR